MPGGEKIAVLVLAVAAVHSIKIFRLYFALYGKGVSSGQHLRQYCKTITVNMIIPLKMGDIFRAYCYGYKMQNYFGGAALIVFDRFTDTLALDNDSGCSDGLGIKNYAPAVHFAYYSDVFMQLLSGISGNVSVLE